jgi:hypothetical protein
MPLARAQQHVEFCPLRSREIAFNVKAALLRTVKTIDNTSYIIHYVLYMVKTFPTVKRALTESSFERIFIFFQATDSSNTFLKT